MIAFNADYIYSKFLPIFTCFIKKKIGRPTKIWIKEKVDFADIKRFYDIKKNKSIKNNNGPSSSHESKTRHVLIVARATQIPIIKLIVQRYRAHVCHTANGKEQIVGNKMKTLWIVLKMSITWLVRSKFRRCTVSLLIGRCSVSGPLYRCENCCPFSAYILLSAIFHYVYEYTSSNKQLMSDQKWLTQNAKGRIVLYATKADDISNIIFFTQLHFHPLFPPHIICSIFLFAAYNV